MGTKKVRCLNAAAAASAAAPDVCQSASCAAQRAGPLAPHSLHGAWLRFCASHLFDPPPQVTAIEVFSKEKQFRQKQQDGRAAPKVLACVCVLRGWGLGAGGGQ